MAASSFSGSFVGRTSSFAGVGEKVEEGSFVGAPGEDREIDDLFEELYPPDTNRWWALVLLSCMSAEQNVIWLTYGPITTVAASYYSTSEWWVGNFLAALGGIVYLPSMLLTTWFANQFGLRATLQVGGLLLGCGAVVRLFATIEWVVVGQTLNSILGPIVMSTPPRLSVEYFPVSERNMATAVSYSSQSLGICLAFLWSPNAVHRDEDMAPFIIAQAAMAGITGFLVMFTFPQPPERALSLSAAAERPDYLQSMAVLSRRPVYIILSLIWGITLGMFVGWMALLPQLLPDQLQDSIGWIGFAANGAGLVGGILVGLVADGCGGQRGHKPLLVGLYGLTAVCFVLLVACVYMWTPTLWQVLLATTGCGFFLNATAPIVLEMAAEYTYPVSEEASAGFLTFVANTVMLVFVLAGTSVSAKTVTMLFIPVLIGATVIMACVPYRAVRTELDTGISGGQEEEGLPPSRQSLVREG